MYPNPRTRTAALLKTAGQLALAAFIALTVAAIAATAVMHAFEPARFGLWSGPHMFFFGALDGPNGARQLTGTLLNMLAITAVLVGTAVCRELLGFAGARRVAASSAAKR